MKKLSILILLFCSQNLWAQNNNGLKLDLAGIPYQNDFKSDHYSLNFNLGVYKPLKQNFSLGLQFRQTYILEETPNNYDVLSSIGLGAGYVFYRGEDQSFWEDGSFAIMADFGTGFSNIIDDRMFVYADLSCRAYLNQQSFITLGYNYKWYESTTHNSNGLYVGFGLRF